MWNENQREWWQKMALLFMICESVQEQSKQRNWHGSNTLKAYNLNGQSTCCS